MSLLDLQFDFTRKLALLVLYAYEIGYTVTYGRVYASEAANKADGGHERSLHTVRLAADLNVFKDRKWLTDGSGHDELHDFWDKLGGATRIAKDMNHYSMEYNGMR